LPNFNPFDLSILQGVSLLQPPHQKYYKFFCVFKLYRVQVSLHETKTAQFTLQNCAVSVLVCTVRGVQTFVFVHNTRTFAKKEEKNRKTLKNVLHFPKKYSIIYGNIIL